MGHIAEERRVSDDGHFDRRNIRGPIGFMAKNGIAANVVMLFLVLAGLASARNLVQEVLPELSLDRVQILVPYPGAAPEEVEESIVRRIEERIRAVDGLSRVEATASEGLASVIAEFTSGTDVNRALNDVKAEVDRIPTFPAATERPEIREITSRQSVIRLLVYGDVPERTLKELAYGIEEGISALPGVSLAEVSGARPYEISIEVPLRRLRALGLTLDDIAFAVRQSSLELSAGRVSTSGEDIMVRTLGQNYEQVDFEEIILLSRPDGTSVRLGEIAAVRDGFADTDLTLRYNGQTAVRVDVYGTSGEQVLDIAEAVKRYLDAEVTPKLPEGVSVALWKDDSEEVGGRLGLMLENALIGLALVFLALALFLEIRLAMWVAVGLAVSFMGTFLVMGFLEISINMFSLMALVLALGIVVDDAIVVGESIFAERERGHRGLAAAIRGARRVSTPVIFSVLTTITAFAVLLNAPGPQGELARGIRGDRAARNLAAGIAARSPEPPVTSGGSRRAEARRGPADAAPGPGDRGPDHEAHGGRPPGPRTPPCDGATLHHSRLGHRIARPLAGGGGVGHGAQPVHHPGRGRHRVGEPGDADGDSGRTHGPNRRGNRSCGTPGGGAYFGGCRRNRRSAGVRCGRHRGGVGGAVRSSRRRCGGGGARPPRHGAVQASRLEQPGSRRFHIRACVAGRGRDPRRSEIPLHLIEPSGSRAARALRAVTSGPRSPGGHCGRIHG